MKSYSGIIIRYAKSLQNEEFWPVPFRSANVKRKIDLKAFEKLLRKMKIENDKLHILFYATYTKANYNKLTCHKTHCDKVQQIQLSRHLKNLQNVHENEFYT